MLQNRVILACFFFAVLAAHSHAQGTGEQSKPSEWPVSKICKQLDLVAQKFNLPRATFTRLIWAESRFDINAVSPAGAQGIAQFMPATAKEWGLDNPYNPKQALETSGAYLSYLKDQFGNWGLAIIAYNAGPGRVEKWLNKRASLPFETRDYIAAVTGQSAETFQKKAAQVIDFSLKEGMAFEKACQLLPVRKTRLRRLENVSAQNQPWGVQVAGNFSRSRAMRSWTRVRQKLRLAIGDVKPELHRLRGLRGMKPKWAVRIGAPNRDKANSICTKIRSAGGSCVVKKRRR